MKPINFSNSTYQSVSETKYPNVTLRALVLGLALAGCGLQAQAAVTTTYTITDLTKLTTPGYPSLNLAATAINNNGLIVGGTIIYDTVAGTVTSISPLWGASRINGLGQVIGGTFISTRPPLSLATVRNTDGTTTQLKVLATDTSTSASDINDKGQVLFTNRLPVCNSGTTCDFTNQSTYYYPQYLWSAAGGVQQLPKMGHAGSTTSINNNGQISGSTYDLNFTEHAFVATATNLKDLHAKSMGTRSVAYKINDSGIVVGRADNPVNGLFYATVWNAATGAYTTVGSGTNLSVLSDVNASGQFIGWEGPGSAGYSNLLGNYAVIGDTNGGGLTDLNTLVTGLPANLKLYDAFDINDVGQILAKAFDVTTNAAYGVLLLTPTTPPPVPPATPSNLSATAASSTQINLTWADNANNETAQYVERCAGAGCTNFTQIASLAADVTSYNDTALTPATSYSYRVRAHSAAGDSTYSNITTASTASSVPVAAPAAPSGLTSAAISRSKIVLSWIDNAVDEQNYLIERCKGSNCTNFNKIATIGANATSYSDNNLTRNTNYSYRVQASNVVGKSAFSNTLNVKTLP